MLGLQDGPGGMIPSRGRGAACVCGAQANGIRRERQGGIDSRSLFPAQRVHADPLHSQAIEMPPENEIPANLKDAKTRRRRDFA